MYRWIIMKIYGSGFFDNERADLTGKVYIRLCLEEVEKAVNFLDSDDPCQYLLAELDILLTLAKKFPDDVFTKVKKENLKKWEDKYFNWFNRNFEKIPEKYREEIQINAKKLFLELDEYANDFSWMR